MSACQNPPLPGLDRARFKGLYLKTAGGLRLFLLRFLSGDRAGAEDMVQQAFLLAWERRDQLRDPGAFKPWLYSIAVNLARARLRSSRPETGTDPDPPARDPRPEEALASAQGVARIEAALSCLPPEQREALLLVRLESLTFVQAAQVLDAPEATVKTRVRRGLLRLADLMES